MWKKIISSDDFNVIDEKNGRSLHADIIVMNSDPYDDNRTWAIPEDRLSKVKIRVTCQGYDKFEGTVSLTAGHAKIHLKKTVETAKYSCRNSDGEDISVTIEGPGAKSSCPLKGYIARDHKLVYKEPEPRYYEKSQSEHGDNDRQHHTSHKKRFAWLEFCYGFITAGLVAVLIWGCIALCSWYSNNTFEWQFGWPPLKVTEIEDNDNTSDTGEATHPVSKAETVECSTEYSDSLDNKYQDGTDKWKKSEMEKKAAAANQGGQKNNKKGSDKSTKPTASKPQDKKSTGQRGNKLD